jgi:NADH-quinone oxidoreductase subunit C
MDGTELVQAVTALEPGAEPRTGANLPAVRVGAEQLPGLMKHLRDDPQFAFDMLTDHTAVDWNEQGHFECIYNLYSTTHGHRLLVSVCVPRDNPVVPSVASLWAIAEWQEREVFDLMGVLYEGHPDLRRLFLEDDWQGHPLRKDYHNADTPELSR